MQLRATSQRMPWGALLGLAGGAALGYFLDPDGGRRRRALARQKVVGALRNERRETLVGALRDERREPLVGALRNERREPLGSAGQGVRAPSRALTIARPRRVQRWRAELERDWLSLHEERWSSRARLGATTLGVSLGVLGMRRGGWAGGALEALGTALVVRGLSNYPLLRLFGIRGARIPLEKAVEIAAPVQKVYRCWDIERFPLFMRRVRSVVQTGPDRFHFELVGPARVPLEWDVVVTRREPERLLVWATEPGSLLQHVGMVRFERISESMTRVSVNLSYDPPAGALGHAVARLFGIDPRSELAQDLSSFQRFVEQSSTLRGERLG